MGCVNTIWLQNKPDPDGGRVYAPHRATDPISGASEYRVNWSIPSNDPHKQTGGPTLIDPDALRPGEEGMALLIPFVPEACDHVQVGTSLTAFEGARLVAQAVVTELISRES